MAVDLYQRIYDPLRINRFCDTFLVILLVILCTAIPCGQLRRDAIHDSLASDSFVRLYAAGVRGLAMPCNCGKFGLKIRRGQPREGSPPLPAPRDSKRLRSNLASPSRETPNSLVTVLRTVCCICGCRGDVKSTLSRIPSDRATQRTAGDMIV